MDLGEIHTLAVNETTAMAISRGRFMKGYRCVDPNEDACLVTVGRAGTLMAVADGHGGFDAARAALQAIEQQAPALVADTIDRPQEVLEQLITTVAGHVRQTLEHQTFPRRHSGTALSVAIHTGRKVTYITAGDTTILCIRGSKGITLGRTSDFLTSRAHPTAAGTVVTRPGELIVVSSDGLFDFLGRSWRRRIAGIVTSAPDPEAASAALIRAACDGGAGDNVAVAIHHIT